MFQVVCRRVISSMIDFASFLYLFEIMCGFLKAGKKKIGMLWYQVVKGGPVVVNFDFQLD